MSSGPTGRARWNVRERTRLPDVDPAQAVAPAARGHVVGVPDDARALHVAEPPLVEPHRPGRAVLVAGQVVGLRVQREADQPPRHVPEAVLAGDEVHRLRPSVQGEEGVAHLLHALAGIGVVREPHGQHVAVAEGGVEVVHPDDVVDQAAEQPSPGAGHVQVGAAPDQAPGVHQQRAELDGPRLRPLGYDEQHVPVLQAVDVDDADPAALVDARDHLGVPAGHQQPAAVDVLGVGRVGGRGDALGPPPLGGARRRRSSGSPTRRHGPVPGRAPPAG